MVFKDWVYFSRAQQRGIVVLLLLIIITPVTSSLITRWKLSKPPDHESFIAEIERMENHLAEISLKSRDAEHKPNGHISLQPFMFNPNTLPEEGWEEMGAPENLGRTIGNYLKAGGSFRYKEDLQRIYTMTDDLYDQLAPYIDLPEQDNRNPAPQRYNPHNRLPEESSGYASVINTQGQMTIEDHSAASADTKMIRPHQNNKSLPPLAIDINRADSAAFRRIPGIGPVFSSRIVRYRDLLGGFFEKEQLLEVYGLDSSHYEQIRPHLLMDTICTIRRIDMNKATFGDLIRHPYLDRNQVNALLALREQHGFFSSPEDIRRSHLITDADWRRLLPYLKTTD